MVLIADDHMVNQLNLQELTGTLQIPRHFDVRLGRGAFTAGMIMLCEAPSYVQWDCCRIVATPTNAVYRVSWTAHNQSPDNQARRSGCFCHERPRLPWVGISFSADRSVLRFISRSIST